jgi:uncharacterized protein YlxW (UPF0749 family)
MKGWDLSKKEWVVPVTVVCLVLGALMALEFRSQTQIALPGHRAEVLAEMLAAERSQVNKQQEEISGLRRDLQALQAAGTEKEKMLKLLNEQLEAGRIAMGLTDVKGPGIVMSLEDSKLRIESSATADALLVHDYDLWAVVNELRSAGAEAISVNDQRVIGETAVRCAGSVLQVNGVPVTSPFEIKAIGDAKTLAGALSIPNGVIDRFKTYQLPAKVQRQEELVIKAIGVAPKFAHARSVLK